MFKFVNFVWADLIIILLIASFSFLLTFNIYIKPNFVTQFPSQGKTGQVLIRADGKEWIYPLNSEKTLNLKGPLGNTVVSIHENKAKILSSPCDNQTCVAAGLLSRKGQWAACLPNNVLLMILQIQSSLENEGEIDAVTW